MRAQAMSSEPRAIYAAEARRPDLGRSRRQQVRRRRLAAVLIAVAALAFVVGVIAAVRGGDKGVTSQPTEPVELVGADGSKLASLPSEDVERVARGEKRVPLPGTRTVENGNASITYRVDQPELRRRLAAAGGGTVTVPEQAVASRISTPVVQQRFPNNCETAALSMLLASQGTPQDQLALQRELPQDGPLDPVTGPDGEMVWGDPEKGYVGRVEGGGTAGGFGVYEGPILDLARQWVDPLDLSSESPSALYDQLLEGKPVFAWIGLQDGPYETWQSQGGEEVTVNYGEHTVLLVGIEGDRLLVNDPLDGVRKWWSKAEFEQMYERLDRRAISVA